MKRPRAAAKRRGLLRRQEFEMMPLTLRDTTLRTLAILGFAIAALITVLAAILSLTSAAEPAGTAVTTAVPAADATPQAKLLAP
jgi:hypothetical protein